MWLIHGNLYDLSQFMDKHPGGKEWLEFTRGTDCTTEFETHHLDDGKMRKYLKTYLNGIFVLVFFESNFCLFDCFGLHLFTMFDFSLAFDLI